MKVADIFNVLSHVLPPEEARYVPRELSMRDLKVRKDGRIVPDALYVSLNPDDEKPLPDMGSFTHTVSLERAMDVFDMLAAREDMAYGYTSNGCFARTHIMCGIIFDEGIVPKKAWAWPPENDAMIVVVGDAEAYFAAYWHVAPVVTVAYENGTNVNVVIDPILFDGPVIFEDWRDAMKSPEKKSGVVHYSETFGTFAGDYSPGCMVSVQSDEQAYDTLQGYMSKKILPWKPLLESPLRKAFNEERGVSMLGVIHEAPRAYTITKQQFGI